MFTLQIALILSEHVRKKLTTACTKLKQARELLRLKKNLKSWEIKN